ncbi:MAG TPA: alpha/beta fold hydrolase [Euzebyales bacterium]
MYPTDAHPVAITLDDVMADLAAGRSAPLRASDHVPSLRPQRRPTIGSPAFLRTLAAAHAFGRVHPRLAHRALLRLWLTPWVHPSTQRPLNGLPAGLRPWTTTHDGTILRGYEGGHGPTVVLLHGWAGRAADWRYLAGDLIAAGWRVVAPDLPAHGATDGATTDIFALGRAAASVLRREQPDVVVTHSLGFPLTLRALEEGAQVPATVVALAPGRRASDALDEFASRARLGDRLTGALRRANQERYGADVFEVLDVDRVVPQLTARGLVIHDSKDADVPLEHGRHIAADWPDAELIITTGLGHRRILRDDHVRGVVVAALTDDLARAVQAGASRNLGAHQPRTDGGERGTEGERHREPLAHQEPRRELSGAPRA